MLKWWLINLGNHSIWNRVKKKVLFLQFNWKNAFTTVLMRPFFHSYQWRQWLLLKAVWLICWFPWLVFCSKSIIPVWRRQVSWTRTEGRPKNVWSLKASARSSWLKKNKRKKSQEKTLIFDQTWLERMFVSLHGHFVKQWIKMKFKYFEGAVHSEFCSESTISFFSASINEFNWTFATQKFPSELWSYLNSTTVLNRTLCTNVSILDSVHGFCL